MKKALLITSILVVSCLTTRADEPRSFRSESGLQITVVREGSGAAVRPGNEVEIHEITTVFGGAQIFSSYESGRPIRFCQNGDMVIEGVNLAVLGMRPGEIREVTVRPRLSGRRDIPGLLDPDDTLHYRIELMGITAGSCAAAVRRYVLRPDGVFDGDSLHEGWSVVVEGDRITAAGPEERIEVPDGAREVTMEGMTLLPGLIEGHSHLFLHPYDETAWNDQVLKESRAYRVARATKHAERTLLAGFTTLRDLGTEGAGSADSGLKRAIEEGLILGPRLLIGGPAIVATGSYGPQGYAPHVDPPRGAETADGRDLARVVRDQIGNGADFIKVYADYRWGPDGEARPTFSLEELELIVDTARDSGRPTVAHAATAEGMRRATLAGVETIEHGDGGNVEVFELMAERGVALCPTLAAGESMLIYEGWHKGTDPTPKRVLDKRASLRRALDSGVTICMGGDAGVYDHGYNALEMELMVEYGMPPIDVLRGATSVNARLFHLEDRLGAIHEGWLADLVAVKGDPLQDITALRDVEFVMQNGKVVIGN